MRIGLCKTRPQAARDKAAGRIWAGKMNQIPIALATESTEMSMKALRHPK